MSRMWKNGLFLIGTKYCITVKINLFQKTYFPFSVYCRSGVWAQEVFRSASGTYGMFGEWCEPHSSHSWAIRQESVPVFSRTAFPMCPTSSYFVVLVFSMTIKTEPNEREGLFAYCNLFCFYYFKVNNHPLSPVPWETCFLRPGEEGPSLWLPQHSPWGFQGRLPGYSHSGVYQQINLYFHRT